MTSDQHFFQQFAMDIGNSRIKWRPFSEPTSGQFSDSLEDIQQTILQGVSPQPVRWYISSVSLQKKTQIVEWLTTFRSQDDVYVVSWRDVPMTVQVDQPEKLGIDRLLAAFAATKKLGDGPILVLDCGTATTIDFVSPNGEFAGGAILPGMETMCRSLHTNTAALPEIVVNTTKSVRPQAPTERGILIADEQWLKPEYPAANTVSAIQMGVLAATVGAALHLWNIACKRTGTIVPIVLTGGDAVLCFSSLRPHCNTIHLCPELVLDGIVHLFGESSSIPYGYDA